MSADAISRFSGCLWLVLGAFGLLFVAGAAGVGINILGVLVPLVVAPSVLALALFGASQSVRILGLSAVTGAAFVLLGVWNYVRAAEFERDHPGSIEISGGAISVIFVLLALAIVLVSGSAALIAWRRQGGTAEWPT